LHWLLAQAAVLDVNWLGYWRAMVTIWWLDTGVTVTALCPGATKTAFATRHEMESVRYFRHAMEPDRVAEIGYRAMQRGRTVVVPGLGNKLQVLIFQLLAPLTTSFMLRRVGRFVMGRER
jgi:short-subunit dehydrogenase